MTLTITSRAALAEAQLPVDALATQMRLPDGWDVEPGRRGRLADTLRAAIATVERRSGQALLTRETVLQGRAAGGRLIVLPLAPVSGIVAVTAAAIDIPLAGAVIERDGVHTRLALTRALTAGAQLTITATAGHGGWADLPEDLAEAALLEAEAVEGGGLATLHKLAGQMITPHRILRLGRG